MTNPLRRIGRGALRGVRAAMGRPDLPGFAHLVRRAYGAPLPRSGDIAVTVVTWRRSHGLESSTYLRLLGPLTSGENAKRLRLTFADAPGAGAAPIGDVVIVQRNVLPDVATAERLLDRVRTAGARLIVDTDDDFRQLEPARIAALEFLMRAADQVWFSTAVLAEAYREVAGDRSAVVPIALDPRLWGPPPPATPPQPDGGLRVLYMGTRTHDADLASVLPAFEVFAAERPGSELCVIGAVTADPGRPFVRLIPTPPERVEYPQFVRWLGLQGPFDLGVAPLVDRPFNAAKAHTKLLDYCALGLPALVVDMPPYRDPSRPPGIANLVRNDTAGWLAALRSFDRDAFDTGRQARLDYVWNGHPIAAVAGQQLALVTALLGR